MFTALVSAESKLFSYSSNSSCFVFMKRKNSVFVQARKIILSVVLSYMKRFIAATTEQYQNFESACKRRQKMCVVTPSTLLGYLTFIDL